MGVSLLLDPAGSRDRNPRSVAPPHGGCLSAMVSGPPSRFAPRRSSVRRSLRSHVPSATTRRARGPGGPVAAAVSQPARHRRSASGPRRARGACAARAPRGGSRPRTTLPGGKVALVAIAVAQPPLREGSPRCGKTEVLPHLRSTGLPAGALPWGERAGKGATWESVRPGSSACRSCAGPDTLPTHEMKGHGGFEDLDPEKLGRLAALRGRSGFRSAQLRLSYRGGGHTGGRFPGLADSPKTPKSRQAIGRARGSHPL
jgi:hypothetical protein